MARLRIPLQARRRHAPPAMEHPASAAARLADVVRRARRSATRAVVFALSRPPARERALGYGASGDEPLSRQAADLCAGAVLRLYVCRKRRAFGGPMVGPPIAGP